MKEYIERTDDSVEIRTMTWRASELLVQEVGDSRGALNLLSRLVQNGDRHPDTLKQMVSIAKESQSWNEAAESLLKLAELSEDDAKRFS